MNLEQRVVLLERRTTRYRNALVLLLAGVCAVAVIGATADDGVIRGRYLVLHNEQGETVIYAGAAADGNGQLMVKSKTGRSNLIYAGVGPGGNGLIAALSNTGTPLVTMGATADDTGFHFGGFNKTGDAVVELSVDDYGNGVVGAYNRKGKGRTLKPGP